MKGLLARVRGMAQGSGMPEIIDLIRDVHARALTDSAALVELRDLVPQLLEYVEQLQRDQAEWIELPRLTLGKITATSDPA